MIVINSECIIAAILESAAMVHTPPLVCAILCVLQAPWGSGWTGRQTLFELDKISTNTLNLAHTNRNVVTQRNLGNVFDLYKMLSCATSCDPLALNNYGNYCGKGDRGGVPVDDIDSCCEQHDLCYDENFEQYRCSSSEVYMWPYEGKCNNGYPICTDYTKCGYWTCVCDKEFVECLKESGCPK